MSEVSISRFNPSLEGVEVCSSWVCVRTVSTWLTLKGETKCVPSGSTSPVTRPKNVSTPTLPGGTYATDAHKKMISKIRPIPISTERPAALGLTVMTRGSNCAMYISLISIYFRESLDRQLTLRHSIPGDHGACF